MKVLFLVARGLHLGYVSGYGNEWTDTPALDRLAAEGVVFDQHYADRPEADAARRAWRTGRYHFPLPDAAEPPVHTTDLLDLLRNQNIATALVSDESRPGFVENTTGWEQVERVAGRLEGVLEIVDGTIARLEKRTDWLLQIELAALLPPWDVPAEFRDFYFIEPKSEEEEDIEEERLLAPLIDPATGPLDDPDDSICRGIQRSYAGAVTYLDRGLEAVLEHLDKCGLLDQIWIIITSDQGMALGEHGIIGPHCPWLHEELIHLPLIVRRPSAVEAGRRVFALTQPVDLMPTLLDAFGQPVPEVHGRSLMPLLRGERQSHRPYTCSGLQIGEAIEYALRTPEWGFMLPARSGPDDPPRGPQLYVKPDDRWEVNNVLQHHLELSEHLEQVLRGFIDATRKPGPLEPPVLRDIETELAAGASIE